VEDDWAFKTSPEALFQLELKQRKQWARACGGAAPAVSSESPVTQHADQHLTPPKMHDVEKVQEQKNGSGPVAESSKAEVAESTSPSAETNRTGKEERAGSSSNTAGGASQGSGFDPSGRAQPIESAPTGRSSEPVQAVQKGQQPGCVSGADKPRLSDQAQADEQPQLPDAAANVVDAGGLPDAAPATDAPLAGNKKRVLPKPKKKKPEAAPEAARQVVDASCPGEKKNEDFDRDLKAMKKKTKKPQGALSKELKASQAKAAPANAYLAGLYASPMSAGERDLKRNMFISFYREEYAKIPTLNISQYAPDANEGLTIKEGHRPMPKTNMHVDLPPDYKQPLKPMSASELLKYGCESQRMLICIHGDLFDVSDRPDKYGSKGPYWAMAGHDISWGLVSGLDDPSTYDKYYDVFKIQPADQGERRLQGLMSWWCFYEKEYGAPVGRLDLYDEEWKLPQPPEIADVCVVM
jgi:hypothetical protein